MMKPIYKKFSEEKSDSETCNNEVGFNGTTEDTGWKGRRKIILAACLLWSVMMLICLLIVGFFLIQKIRAEQNDIISYEKPLSGHNGVTQTVFASVEDNYVQYYISTHISERTWILDDFNVNLQIMKSQTDTDTICYVSKLNVTEAMHPSRASENELAAAKKNYHDIYSPDEYPVTDRSFLGLMGQMMCEGIEVYWLHPMNDVIDITDLGVNMNATAESQTSPVRRKRNIRSCTSSCCWLVCCCDLHHFNWEASDRFTCKHVCEKCTKAFKQKIQKIC